ncbi:MAG: TIGR03960 family B12-binding radical SAM protein [Syntrophales bacterium]|nr:TIGR03960 family B12-binding radical SAM protein [Syntrophales bacterium]
MSENEIETILPLVQKPARYTGGETNVIQKNRGKSSLSFALAFPDVYEVGMSHQGLHILYGILNLRTSWRAERVYAPWPDMASLMVSRGLALSSLESGTPLYRFDIVGFSLQYELSCTNVFHMLDLGRIPLRAVKRREEHPLVIAGGPGVFNPEPMIPFFDAFALGEGEEMVVEIAEEVERGKTRGLSRRALLERLAGLDGLYVPSFHGKNRSFRKRVIADLDGSFLPERPVVPLIKTIHDRITLEIARGCTRGCRFCQAGMVCRPTRERSPDLIIERIQKILAATGYDEISLLSLSSGDHSCIGPLIEELMDRNADNNIALALPSLRAETLTESLIEQIKRVRKTSFTLAPEAGTQRLRDVINKGNREEDLLRTVQSVFAAGWGSIKLYFMIGLPTESQEDLEGIVELIYKVLRAGGGSRQVTAGFSTFVPKPHTPFQWERQISPDETEERQRYFKDILRRGNLRFKWHDRRMSFLEGLISRGDLRIADVMERAYELGARFDGWSDRFRFELWEQALKDTGVDPGPYLESRDPEASLPWDHIDAGVKKEFLLREKEKAREEILTEDCRTERCSSCGACSDTIELRTASPANSTLTENNEGEEPAKGEWKLRHFRMRYSKIDKARFLSHLDTASALTRAITRSGLRFEYSRGFHPHPKISFPSATPLGVESNAEYADIRVNTPRRWNRRNIMEAVNGALPSGMAVLSIEDVTDSGTSLSRKVIGFVYEMHLSDDEKTTKEERQGAVKKFLDSDRYMVHRSRDGKSRERNIRPFVESLVYVEEGEILRGVFLFTDSGSAKPYEILTYVMGLDENTARSIKTVKTHTVLANG